MGNSQSTLNTEELIKKELGCNFNSNEVLLSKVKEYILFSNLLFNLKELKYLEPSETKIEDYLIDAFLIPDEKEILSSDINTKVYRPFNKISEIYRSDIRIKTSNVLEKVNDFIINVYTIVEEETRIKLIEELITEVEQSVSLLEEYIKNNCII